MSDEKYTSSLSPEEQEKRAERTRERQVKALAGLSVGGSGGAEADGTDNNNNNDDGPAGSGVAEAEAFLQGDTGLSTDAADLAPFEEKWGFSFSDLQSAVRVVSTLFSNPSLYVGDPYLAESRLYTMITRDRRTKKEHRDSFKQIMNEEKRRRDKMKRAQDLETIKKTTMKREREDALNQLLLVVNADNDDEDDDEDGRDGRAQQLLLQQRQQRGTTSTSAAQLALTSSLSTPINSGKQNEKAPLLEGNGAGTTSVVEVAQQRLSNKRGLAAFELMETVYNPASLAVDCLTIHALTLDLCPQAVQEWRCFLTAAYHRFMPTLPFGTQMVHCLPTSDYFGQKPELIPTSSQHCHAVLHASQRLLLGLRVFATEATTAASCTAAPSQVAVPSLGTAIIKETECILHLSLSLKELLLPARQYRTSEAGEPPMGVPVATVNEIFTSWKVQGESGGNGDSGSSCIFARSAHASSHFARSAQRLSANNGYILSRLVGADLSTSNDSGILRGTKPPPIKPTAVPATVILSATSLRHAMITSMKEETLPTPPPLPADVSLITLLQAVRLQCEYLLDSSSSSILTAHGTEASVIVAHLHRSLSEFITAVTTTLQLSGEVLGSVLMGLLSLLAVVTRSHAQAREDASTCELDDVSINTVGINEVIFSPTAFKAAYTQPLRFCNDSSSSSPPTTSSLYGSLLLPSSSSSTTAEEEDHPSPSPSTPVVTLQRLSDTVAAVMALVLYTADTDNYITMSIACLFNELWFDLPKKAPEALPDGTILREEGFFENVVEFVPLSTYEQDEQFPYQDAMVFITSTKNNNTQQQQHEKKGGTMMMLTKETSEELRMNRVQKCHTCKGKYSFLHPFYYSLCRPCGEFNYHKRLMTRDLTGKVVLLTGCRIKIGFAMALSLLRCGATVIGTTRFSVDAMGRFSEEPDYDIWKHRLHLYTIDLRDMWLVTEFCAYIGSKFPKLFGIINNAAQTIARTPAYTAELRRLEAQPPAMLRARLDKDADATAWYHYYHSNSSVIVGRSLTLEHHPVTNPVLHDDLSLEANAVASSSSVTESKVDRDTRLKKAGGDDGALTSHLKGDSLGKAVAQRYDRYDTYAEESDKREQNTWTTNMAEVEGSEAAEVMAINALSPFILNAKLKPLLMNRAGEEPEADINEEPEVISHSARKAGAHHIGKYPSSGRFIINVSAMEGQFYRHKQTTHPHTNMAKAALNMMTRTSAEDYAKDGIYMNSVDTGWITDESPAEKKKHRAQESMLCPLDEVDAAARCLDLIYTDSREYGKFYKNFITISW